MQRVIVTVRRENEGGEHDLEVPAELAGAQLAERIAAALRWDSTPAAPPLTYQIEARPLGRVLGQQESLADAGVWDGAWLVLHPVVGPAPVVSGAPRPADLPAPAGGPLRGWRPLGIDLPASDPPPPAPAAGQRSGGYVWKQVDE